ncbi:ATP-binding cassette domain-containing protein [Corynebacterium liangguodongii]|uniref:ABC transporter ATP-binding protein n=1 Tax=Corynebacterium liangguodongii TaxID=2079535 RepID=A0A2S0WFP5_9CORY|nr:ABC transporter ATP-binding protein [Corynebacterium liangguodongii]AWB84492.1 ABC transporter ATP-binding protein [Corynebacterium liangguodongii]PWB98710.1 ABC transporter ATP-binding protein [Corynebacterium liangguodongii]
MISVRDLTIEGILHGVSFDLARGERVGIIGESGSGKSLTALSIMGLVDTLPLSGSITVDGVEMVGTRDRVRRRVRGRKVAMVFQEPMTALDPLMRVGRQVSRDPERARALLGEVGVARPDAYPHELSGGQRQRVLIAAALAQDPDVLICDEPTTALDATVQGQILDLIDSVVAARGMGLLFISHDLAVVERMTERVLVFKDGRIVAAESDYARSLVAASRPGPPAPARPLGEPVVALRDVKLTRGSTRSLDGVTLTVRRGERLGLVGGSGSGKTSLLRVIAGLSEPDAGTAEVAGEVQMVFQDPYSSLDPRMSVGASIRETGVDAARAEEVLAQVGLAGVGERTPRKFSGGQRQRISIARAAAPRPAILLADEPVSALDVTVRRTVLDLIDAVVGEGTLVFVSHDLALVRELCPTVAVIHEGRIVEHGATEDVWSDPQHPYTQALIESARRAQSR